MQVSNDFSQGFQSRDYYDGVRNAADSEYQALQRKVDDLENEQSDEDSDDSRLDMMLAELTGLGRKINFSV